MGERVGWIEGTGGDGRKQFWEESDLLVSNFVHGQGVTCPLTFTEIERENFGCQEKDKEGEGPHQLTVQKEAVSLSVLSDRILSPLYSWSTHQSSRLSVYCHTLA